MSHASAIAAVTATLGARLTRVLDGVQGLNASVSHTRPGTANAFASNAGIHLFLYMVTPSSALRNNDLPTRDAAGKLVQRPTAALELHYLLSFVGDETNLEPQLMLGATTVDLHTRPTLDANEIRAATLGRSYENSRLEQQVERVRLSGEAIDLEEFSKLWSVFFQTQYLLSVAYKASVVLLEAELDTPMPAPVRSREVWSTPLPPTIESVAPMMARPSSRVRLRGSGFVGRATMLRFLQAGGVEVEVEPSLLLDDRIEVELPGTLAAGLSGVQVVTRHEPRAGDTSRAFELESSVAALTIVPHLVDGSAQPIVSLSGTLGSAIAFDVVPPLTSAQTLEVVIGSLRVQPDSMTTSASSTHVDVTLPSTGLEPATTYALRVAVDHITSLVEADGAEFKPRLLVGGP